MLAPALANEENLRQRIAGLAANPPNPRSFTRGLDLDINEVIAGLSWEWRCR